MTRILPGDFAPGFVARSDKNPHYSFQTAAGRYLVLAFIPAGDQYVPLRAQLAASANFDDTHAALFIVTPSLGDAPGNALPLRIPGVRAFFDDDGFIANLYGLAQFEQRPVSFILSPRMQVVSVVTASVQEHAAHVHAIIDHLPRNDALPAVAAHPPILLIPDVFEPALCQTLIQGYQHNGGESSGFMRDVNGKTVRLHDANHKVRRDWSIDRNNTQLIQLLQQRFTTRVVPEIKKAFQFQATRMERYIVSCYDAHEGGHFRPHRDNTTKGTAHRRFAVSVNLNAEDYEGGELRFPEYGRTTYRPPTGGCCVFSCSLLHEATPVTQGVRYAFLPFLYDESAYKIRQANAQYVDLTNQTG